MASGRCTASGPDWSCDWSGPLHIGFCGTHYHQQNRGASFTPRRPARVRADGHLLCGSCREYLPPDMFHLDRTRQGGRAGLCRKCQQTYALAHKWGLTMDQWEALLESQGGGCAVCGVSGCASGRAFAVDHDHQCCLGARSCGKCVRGLLCADCNRAIGLLRDDPVRIRSAAEYVERAAARA